MVGVDVVVVAGFVDVIDGVLVAVVAVVVYIEVDVVVV